MIKLRNLEIYNLNKWTIATRERNNNAEYADEYDTKTNQLDMKLINRL